MAHPVRFSPHVAALPPYNAGLSLARARDLTGHSSFARLAGKKNPDGCSLAVMAALASSAFEPWHYSDPAATALRTALCPSLSVDPALIVAGNGSKETIAAIARAILVPGARVVTVVLCIGRHEIDPLAAGAVLLKVPMTPTAGFDLAALEAAIAAGPRVVFLSTPWNPVGPALDHTGLAPIIAAVKPGTLLVLDDAYVEFAGPDRPDGIKVLRDSDIAWVVLRTFYKAYGLAGLRVGYAVCDDTKSARVIRSACTAFNANGATQVAAVAALGDTAWMQAAAARIRAERTRVAAALSALGLTMAPSQTNFLYLDMRRDGGVVATALLHAGLIVKAWREAGYENWLRVMIGTPADNDRLISAMAGVMA